MQDRLVVALVRDLFFGVRLVDFVRLFGYELERAETSDDLIKTLCSTHPALVIVDLEYRPGDLSEIARHAGTARLLAFGAPADTESCKAARAAGFDEVVVNNQFHRELRALLGRNLGVEAVQETQGAGKRWRRLWGRVYP